MNAHGAHISQDENGNYYYRVGDVATPTPEKVEVFYNADDPDVVDAYGEMLTVVEEFENEEHQPNVPMETLKSMCKIAWIPTTTDEPIDGLTN